MHTAVPSVEVADHADTVRVRRPHGEMDAGGRTQVYSVRAELLEDAVVGSLAEKMKIEVGQHTAVPIRIVHFEHMAARKRETQAVIGNVCGRQSRFEQRAVAPEPAHRRKTVAGDQSNRDGFGSGMTRADDDRFAVIRTMGTKHCERIAFDSLGKSVSQPIACVTWRLLPS